MRGWWQHATILSHYFSLDRHPAWALGQACSTHYPTWKRASLRCEAGSAPDISQPHAVTAAFSNTYAYDGSGNQVSRVITGTTSYTIEPGQCNEKSHHLLPAGKKSVCFGLGVALGVTSGFGDGDGSSVGLPGDPPDLRLRSIDAMLDNSRQQLGLSLVGSMVVR